MGGGPTHHHCRPLPTRLAGEIELVEGESITRLVGELKLVREGGTTRLVGELEVVGGEETEEEGEPGAEEGEPPRAEPPEEVMLEERPARREAASLHLPDPLAVARGRRPSKP